MKTFGKLTNFLNKLVLEISAVMFLLMAFAAIWQVFTRYATATSAPWTEEYARYLFIYVALLGATIAVKSGGHVAVNLVTDRLKGKLKHAVAIFATLMGIGFFCVMIYAGYFSMLKAAMQVSPATETNMGLVYASVPISGALMLLYSIEVLLNLLIQGPPPEVEATIASISANE